MAHAGHHNRPDILVIELHDIVDLDTQESIEHQLRLAVQSTTARTVVLDIHVPLVTSTALHLFLRLRQSVQDQGAMLCVVARHAPARRVFRITGLMRQLRVSATLSGVMDGCGPPTHAGAGAACLPLPGERAPLRVVRRISARG